MKPPMPKSPFATGLSGSAREVELRLHNIFQWKKCPLLRMTANK